jgi:hypothetical protein
MNIQMAGRWKICFWFGAAYLAAAFGLEATPVCPQSGTYAQLEAFNSSNSKVTGGCTIDGLVFFNFTFSSSVSGQNAVAPASASAVDYMTIPPYTAATGQFGFDFNSFPLEVIGKGVKGTATMKIGYSVEATQPKEYIVDGGLVGEDAAAVGSTASVTTAETFTPPKGTDCFSTVTKNASCSFSAPAGSAGDYIDFNPNNNPAGIPADQILKVAKTLTATATANGSLAHISEFADVVTVTGVVPEPSFYVVLAAGLAVLLLAVRRKRRAA